MPKTKETKKRQDKHAVTIQVVDSDYESDSDSVVSLDISGSAKMYPDVPDTQIFEPSSSSAHALVIHKKCSTISDWRTC